MKQQLLILLFLLAIGFNGFAQPPAIQWQKPLGGSNQDAAYAIQQTTDGGYIVAGYSESNDSEVSGNHGNSDYWIVKLSDTGTIQWQKSLGGSGADYADAIQQTSDGGYIVAGWSFSIDGEVSGNHGNSDYWVVKINDTGAVQWQKSLGGSDEDAAAAIQQTSDGGYIVAGYSYSNDGQVSGHHGGDTLSDYWVVKLNDTGAIQWQRSLGGSSMDAATSLRQTSDGGYIVAGTSYSNDGDVSGNHGFQDYWIVKLNDTGAIQWQKCLGGSESDWCYAIQQTTDGGYIVGGSSYSIDGDVSGNHGDFDYWVVKLNDTGVIQWQKSLGGSDIDVANAVQQTTDGGYIVAGYSISNDSEVSGNHGGQDYWIVKLNYAGAIQWQKSLGGSQGDWAEAIQQTTDGGYIIAGYSESNDSEVSGNHGGYDYWVVRLACSFSAGFIYGDSVVCLGKLINLSDTVAGGTWNVTNTKAAISGGNVNGIAAGTDTAIYTITNVCGSGTASFTFNVILCPSSVNQIPITNGVTIIPNPTSGNISIMGVESVHIKVYNTIGQLIKEANNTDIISIAALPAGMYFVRVFNDREMLIKEDKIIKE